MGSANCRRAGRRLPALAPQCTAARESKTPLFRAISKYGGFCWHVRRYEEGTWRGGCGCGRTEVAGGGGEARRHAARVSSLSFLAEN
ncbi:hypothetical protein ES332_A03G052000v1 [Gossypium tomentosum]|uniref:Uncharacterized protein n=1 Tax=Gossypium tomentosum TaxID=34277 RepID=A0A5D2R3E4_GOSTO|nr:hypothetical protein ES332_A03G052000v1 [Gossypium tomentosum]